MIARLALLALVAALAAALAMPSSAGAAKRMELAVQDDPVFLDQAYYDRERALQQARALGVTWIRTNVIWSQALGSQAREKVRPQGLVYDWAKYDGLIDAAARYGIRVQLTLAGPAPAFATSNRKVGVFGPKAEEFGYFVRAAVQHFKGRVPRYSMWNEANFIGWLAPMDLAPALYRELYVAGYKALKRADRNAQIFIGELSPYAIRRRAMAPLEFLRKVTCTKKKGGASRAQLPKARPLALERRACPGLKADGFAHHPYDYRHAPEFRWRGSDNATLGTLENLTSTLAGLAKVRALTGPRNRPLDVYLTEYGYFNSGTHAMGDEVRARYLPDAYALAQRHRTVRQMLQYGLVTPPEDYPGAFFDLSIVSGLGQELAPYGALKAWSDAARARRDVVHPGRALALPPAPAARRGGRRR